MTLTFLVGLILGFVGSACHPFRVPPDARQLGRGRANGRHAVPCWVRGDPDSIARSFG